MKPMCMKLSRIEKTVRTDNAEGGMEDYEIILRAYKTKKPIPFLGSEKVKISLRSGLDFEKKILSENRTILKIEKKYDKRLIALVNNHIRQQNNNARLKSYFYDFIRALL